MPNSSFAPGTRFGIIGHPLGHSLSPALHNWAFGRAGLAYAYEAWPLPPEELETFIATMRGQRYGGASVTIPHKEGVIPLLDEVSARARGVGAVNTLYWNGDRLCGENTDVEGFIAPLRALGGAVESAMVLGAGGAARAVLAGLKEWGVAEIALANRTRARADELAAEFGVAAVDWEARTKGAALVVNTTPLGMSGAMADKTPWPAEAFASGMIAYDIVYNPLTTRFLAEARDAGCTAIDGLEMFLGQAVAQFRLWTGRSFDLAGARRLLLDALAR